jgi:glutaredoxin 3
MKFTITTLAISAVAVLAATATAFTVGPQKNALSTTASFSPSSRPSTTLKMSQDEFAKSEIESNDVVVFSKSYCPFCIKTKDLFDSMGVKYAVHELDKIGDDGPELQMALFKMTGQKSVPNVFVKGQHIGGNDDTQAAAKAGKLQEMLGIAAK